MQRVRLLVRMIARAAQVVIEKVKSACADEIHRWWMKSPLAMKSTASRRLLKNEKARKPL